MLTRRRRHILTALIGLGTFILSLAWCATIPPFAAMDEFDHAFRAGQVGHGQLTSGLGPARDGRGGLVVTDRSLVVAAERACEARNYTGPDNCTPVSGVAGASDIDAPDSDLAVVASAADSYPPLYYALVGWLVHPFGGDTALYAMRGASALVCTLLVALAAWVITGWARTRWPVFAVVMTLTSTALYTFSIVAPNGLEMALGLVFWAALLGLRRRTEDSEHAVRGAASASAPAPILLAVVSGSLFALTRPLGSVWLLIIVLTWLLLVGWSGLRNLMRARPVGMAAGMACLALSALASALWVAANPGSAGDQGEGPTDSAVSGTLQEVPLWFLQNIAEVPFRNTPAPMIVYALGLLMFGIFFIGSWRAGGRHARVATVTMVVLVLFGAGYTFVRYPSVGPVWQGRYVWCLACGVLLLLADALGRRSMPFIERFVHVATAAATSIIPIVMLVSVLRFERRQDAVQGLAWAAPPTWTIVGCAALGAASLTASLMLSLRWLPAVQAAHELHDENAVHHESSGRTHHGG